LGAEERLIAAPLGQPCLESESLGGGLSDSSFRLGGTLRGHFTDTARRLSTGKYRRLSPLGQFEGSRKRFQYLLLEVVEGSPLGWLKSHWDYRGALGLLEGLNPCWDYSIVSWDYPRDLHWDHPGISTGTARQLSTGTARQLSTGTAPTPLPLGLLVGLHWDCRDLHWDYPGGSHWDHRASLLGLLDSAPLGILDGSSLGLLEGLHWECWRLSTGTARQHSTRTARQCSTGTTWGFALGLLDSSTEFIRRRRGQVWFRNTLEK
jgi:hypothetical protein